MSESARSKDFSLSSRSKDFSLSGSETKSEGFTTDFAGVHKILAVRLDNMGDLLMTTQALRALQERFPAAELVLLTSQTASALAPYVPVIDRWLVYDAPWVKTYAEAPTGAGVMALAEQLQNERFDLAVIFTVYSQNPLPAALLTLMAGIPLRLGYSHENPYHLLTHWFPDPEPQKVIKQEVQRQLDLVARIGAVTTTPTLALKVDDAARQRTQALLQSLGLHQGAAAGEPVEPSEPTEAWLLLHPGVSEERRRYHAWGFAEAGKRLSRQLGWRILVSGGPEERALAAQVAGAIGEAAVNLAGELSLAEFIALVAVAPLLITNNSGPVHIAAALGTPVVDLYATTNPQHTPWLVDHRVLYFDTTCKACERGICTTPYHGQQRYLQPQEIVQAALALLTEVQGLPNAHQGAMRGEQNKQP